MPASASVFAAVAISSLSSLRGGISGLLESRLLVRCGKSIEQGVEIPVEHLVEIVRLEVDAVVGDPVLGEVVGADPFAAVHGSDLAGPVGRCIGLARALFCNWERSFWQVTTTPVGRCVMRTAESVVFTPCPPLPDDR